MESENKQNEIDAVMNNPLLANELPLLVMTDFVLFPHVMVPLILDEQEQITELDDAVNGNAYMGIILQCNKLDENNAITLSTASKPFYRYGCLAKIRKLIRPTPQNIRVLVDGIRKFRILKINDNKDYPTATVEFIHEEEISANESKVLRDTLGNSVLEYCQLCKTLPEEVSQSLKIQGSSKIWINLLAAYGGFTLEEKQQLLSCDNIRQRAKMLTPLVNRELELLKLGQQIHTQVAAGLAKTQKEFYLREQLKIIQKQLGNGENPAILRLKEMLNKISFSPEIQNVLRGEFERLSTIPYTSPEYSVTYNYLDTILHLPWNKQVGSIPEISQAKELLDKNHFGLQKVKQRILEYVAAIKMNPEGRPPILCLTGAPGVGKTSLGKSIAEILGRPFCSIALGGVRDVVQLRGTRRTYVGALPGRIIQNIKVAGACNPVFLLDEIDKLGENGDSSAALLEILDPSQNKQFIDNYLEIPFDLSQTLFITTANWLEPVHPALKDRMEVIEICGYTVAEKIQIAQQFIIPKQLKEAGLAPDSIQFQDTAIQGIIENHTGEQGVRELERKIASIIRKILLFILEMKDLGDLKIATNYRNQLPIQISQGNISLLLEDSNVNCSIQTQLASQPGVAQALAKTPCGGCLISIESAAMPGKGNLILTGNLGNSLRESAQTALSLLRSQSKKLGIELTNYYQQDVHIHIPNSAIPKDGPSAGIAIFAALVSLFKQVEINKLIAMTGEITLTGNLLAVGGISEKILAAKHIGIQDVILPEQNRKDWEKLSPETRNNLTPHFFEHALDVINYVFSHK